MKPTGGARPGAGRKKADGERINIRLPSHLIRWVRRQPGTYGEVIQAALEKTIEN